MNLILLLVLVLAAMPTQAAIDPVNPPTDPCSSNLTNSASRAAVAELLRIYGVAWETRDPDLITTIFTPDATYHDPKEPENIGLDAIRSYWVRKVVYRADLRQKLSLSQSS